MTTQTLTLTEFLLARIAEDEAVARAYPERFWYDAIKVEEDDPLREFLDRFAATRILAECESKRRIVERLVGADSDRSGDDHEDAAAYYALRGVCQDLALPYAAHPDYDEKWRP